MAATSPCQEDLPTSSVVSVLKQVTLDPQKGADIGANAVSSDSVVLNKQDEDHISSTACEEDLHCLSISDLPEVILVQVMDNLDLQERYALSQTCRQFYELFSHPRLWRKAHIRLRYHGQSNTKNQAEWKLGTFQPHTIATLVRRFAHFFQNLTLELQGFLQNFDEDSTALLALLSSNCRLESLTLQLGLLASTDAVASHVFSRMCKLYDLPLVVDLIHKAYKLKHLSILSWPLQKQTNDDKDIYKAIMENKKLEGLQSLNLFFPDLFSGKWTERVPKLPSPQLTTQLVEKLPNLSQLSLRSPMLSSELLMALASHQQMALSALYVLVQGPTSCQPPPIITSQAWQSLHQTFPSLEVEVVIFSRIPDTALQPLLQPAAQIKSLVIHTFGRCDSELILNLAEGHKESLRQFICYYESQDCEKALLYLASVCNLNSLIYYGEIHYTMVEKIASLMMNQNETVKVLEFLEKNIKTHDILAGNDSENDADIIVAVDAANRELYLPSLQAWHQDEEVRQRKLEALISHVSQCLRRKWMPV